MLPHTDFFSLSQKFLLACEKLHVGFSPKRFLVPHLSPPLFPAVHVLLCLKPKGSWQLAVLPFFDTAILDCPLVRWLQSHCSRTFSLITA